jgi:hypothetical protein
MKLKTAAALAALLGVAFAAPALAKTSIQKGEQICEDAAKSQSPAPKSVRVDKDGTLVNNDTATFLLRVKNADDSSAKVTCTVDRETDGFTLKTES